MKKIVQSIALGVVLLLLIALVLSVGVALAFGAYWLTLWAGAPKYVAVIVGILVFMICGVSYKSSK